MYQIARFNFLFCMLFVLDMFFADSHFLNMRIDGKKCTFKKKFYN